MNRKKYVDIIAEKLAIFEAEVRSFNDMSLYDYNIHAENALIPILNTVYGLKLVNANSGGSRNFPAIDLIDENNRIAFQITVTTGIEKIKNTLVSFGNYELDKKFDTLNIFILSKKQSSYSENSIKEAIPKNFDFDLKKNILDFSDLRRRIMDIQGLEILAYLSKICTHEFSDIQVNERKKVYQNQFLKNEPEKIFLNLLKLEIPQKMFIADLDIDEQEYLININEARRLQNKKQYGSLKPETLVREVMRIKEIYGNDYVIRESKLITFRDLHNNKERISSLIDKGTIVTISPEEYYDSNEDHISIFKNLLRQTLIDYGYSRGLEWFPSKSILRFKNNRFVPRVLKKNWKKTNNATKTVIFEMMNKKEGHVICFRSMAFEPSFEIIEKEWFLVINPTWSFTNPGGYKTSKFESSYMSGLKRQERNNTVYYQYRFWCYYFLYPDMQSPNSKYIRFEQFQPFEFSPSIDDSKWLPQKEFKPQNERESELDLDNELSLKHFS